jgi:hypothetical protein
MAQVVEDLPNNHETPSSTPSTAKKKILPRKPKVIFCTD